MQVDFETQISKIITGFPQLEGLRIRIPSVLHAEGYSEDDGNRVDTHVRRWGEACRTLKELWVSGEGFAQGLCFGRQEHPGCGAAELIRKDADDFVIINGLEGTANHIGI
jgi:hypothetical protein